MTLLFDTYFLIIFEVTTKHQGLMCYSRKIYIINISTAKVQKYLKVVECYWNSNCQVVLTQIQYFFELFTIILLRVLGKIYLLFIQDLNGRSQFFQILVKHLETKTFNITDSTLNVFN